MKKVIKNYLAKLQENENKGFSLVELIIVMAIMAILVGVVASQVIPYMEKSRQSKDQQVLSSLLTDINSAIASGGEAVAGGTNTLGNLSNVTNAATVTELQGYRNNDPIATIESKAKASLKSKAMKGSNIYVSVDSASGDVIVFANSTQAMPSNNKQIAK